MTVKLIEATDTWMTRPRVFLPRGKHFYPSEASVTWTDHHGLTRTAGACIRQVWYRLKGDFEYATVDAYGEWIFALGKAVEEILVEQWKQMGIWVANNVKFYDVERNISGEIDVLLSEPDGTLFCVEVKSFYGYMATRDIVGNKKITGKPKTSQLLQALIYTDLGKRENRWDYTKMVYYARDSASRAEFDVRLQQDGEHLRPTVNNVIDYRFTMDDIYQRYDELAEALQCDTPPPRDYEISYDVEKVKVYHDIGEIGKTAFEKFKKSPKKYPIGDWQCRYCGYRNVCWGEE